MLNLLGKPILFIFLLLFFFFVIIFSSSLFRQQFEKLFADFVALMFVAEEKWFLRKAFNMFDALRNVVIILFYESKKL